MGREISGRRPWKGKGRVERGAKLAYIKVQKGELSLGVFLHNFKKAFLARLNWKGAKQFGEMTESLNLLPLFARVLTVGLGLSLSDLRQIIPTSFSSLSSPTFHHSSFPVLQKKSPPEKIYFFFLLFFCRSVFQSCPSSSALGYLLLFCRRPVPELRGRLRPGEEAEAGIAIFEFRSAK